METIDQNVRITGEKGDLSLFIGCLLVGVIRSKLISVQLDHPVGIVLDFFLSGTDSPPCFGFLFSLDCKQDKTIFGKKYGINLPANKISLMMFV